MSTPEAGDRVRVVLEGEIEYLCESGFDLRDGRLIHQHVTAPSSLVVSVEVLAPPNWWPPKPGDVARYAFSTYLREADRIGAEEHDRPWTNMSGARLKDAAFLRLHRDDPDAVALLVRDGKPVQP